MIKVIAFDFTGVVAPGPLMQWIKENLTPDDERYTLAQKSSHKWDMGEVTLDEAYILMSKITGVSPELIWESFFEKSIANNDVIELIKRLKPKYKIALFSNHLGELLRKLLAKHEIADLFDEIIISSEHRKKKPDPKFFQKFLKIINVRKSEIVFIDDTKVNVDASNSLGIKAILYVDSEQLVNELHNLGVKS
ncbi:MAG: HAD-IA family hydrolase [bacterium]|nr:HAD-IA family hydrolase [bacterium]